MAYCALMEVFAARGRALAGALIAAMGMGCTASGRAAPAGRLDAADGVNAPGALHGALYEPGRTFVQTYCAECHWQQGQDPKQKVAYPAFHVDTYEDWAASRTILLAVLDKWNPDGDLMPPPDAPDPEDEERRTILDWIGRDSPNTASGR